jgi:hypothetical protein
MLLSFDMDVQGLEHGSVLAGTTTMTPWVLQRVHIRAVWPNGDDRCQ